MKFFFENQHNSLVIGANGAIGNACVKVLNSAGADVTEIDLNYPSQTSKQNKFLKCDVSNIEDVINSAKKIKSIDSVIYAVGLNHDSSVIDTDWKEYRKVMSANLDSAFHIGAVYGKRMATQGFGSFVFLSSSAGLKGEAGASIYCASKFGLIGFVESFAAEMTPHNVRVNCISPGNVDSPMLKDVANKIAARIKTPPQTVLEEMAKSGSAQRLVKPEEVANLAVFLASDMASGITGSNVRIDCGAWIDS